MATYNNNSGTTNDSFKIGKNGPNLVKDGNNLVINATGNVEVADLISSSIETTDLVIGNTTFIPNVVPITSVTGTTYVLLITDQYVRCSNTEPQTILVPLNSAAAYPIGYQISIIQTNTGPVTINATGGVTINYPETLILRKQYSAVTLTKVATDTWDLIGDTELAA